MHQPLRWRHAAPCAVFAMLVLALAGARTAPAEAASAAAGGLVAAYSFDAGSGTTLTDESGNGNTGALSGATWTTGRFGGALSFDGVDDWVTVADAAELDLSSGMTLEAWIRPKVVSFWKAVLVKEQAGDLTYGLFAGSDTSVPTGQVQVSGQQIVRGPSALPLSTWTHLATTFDGAAQRLYVNGALVATRAQSGSMPGSSGALRIGGTNLWPDEFFQGKIDEVRIYDRALSAAEIQADMSTAVGATPPPPATPLVAAYSFDAGSGTTLADHSGNGNAGAISGAAWSTAGRFGGALSFDGINDWVTVADAADLDLSSGMTLEAWVRPDVTNFWKAVIVKEQTGDLVYGLFAGSDTGVPTGQVHVTAQQIVRGPAALPLGTWSHLATTFDGTAQRLYVNGTLVATRAQTGSMPASSAALRIGGTTLWPNEWFDGLIDEVRIYAGALSASEIQADMNTAVAGGTPPPPPPPPPPADTTAPSTPANLTVTGVTQTSLTLSWSPSIDNVGVVAYDTFRNGAASGTGTGTSYAFSGLTCGTTYTLAVEARDAAGNRSARASVGGSTSACPPPPPPPPSGSTANLWIDTSGGSCTRSGTLAGYVDGTACGSMSQALTACQPGDTINMRAGNYGAQWISVFKSAPGCTITAEPTTNIGDLDTNGSWYEIRNVSAPSWDLGVAGSHDITLRNVHIAGSRGIYLNGAGYSNIRWIGGSFRNFSCSTCAAAMAVYAGDVAGGSALVQNFVIDGVTFDNIQNTGGTANHFEVIRIDGNVDGFTLRNSTFTNTNSSSSTLFFSTFRGSKPRNILLENNFFGRPGAAYFVINENYQGASCSNWTIRYNTFLSSASAGGNCSYSNIVWTGNLAPGGGCQGTTFIANVWYGSGPACGPSDKVTGSPGLGGAGGFYLQPGSPAIDAGGTGANCVATDHDGAARPKGSACDAGAHEAG